MTRRVRNAVTLFYPRRSFPFPPSYSLSPIPFLRFVRNLRIFLLALLALEKGLTKKSTIIIMFLQFAANQRIFF